MESGHLYILQRNDKKGTNIYKIGMTERSIFNRINKEASYRDCIVIETRIVDNGRKAENDLKNELKNKNIKRCKDNDENYQGIEDYIIDDINYVVKLFNEVCDRNEISKLNHDTKTETQTINPLILMKNEIYENNFENLVEKRKAISIFLGFDKKSILSIWFANFDKIFKAIEIISGLGYSKSNPYRTFLIDTSEMYKISHFNKSVTITRFKTFMSNICDRYCNKYGKVTYRTEFNTPISTSAQLYLISPSSIKILLNTDIILSKLNNEYTIDFIKTLYKYDYEDCNEMIKIKLLEYDDNIINYCKFEKFTLVIDNNIEKPIYNKQHKTITINKKDYTRFSKFSLLFRNNVNIDYELLTKHQLLTKDNCEDFIIYIQNFDTVLRCLINDESNLINVIIEFMYDKIYNSNNCRNKLHADKFKKLWYKEFEKHYNNILNLSDTIKIKLYNLLDKYIIDNNKLKNNNMFMSCKL